jgi:hypothetical protein
MVDINIPIILIAQRYQYLLITPRAHPSKCSQVKRKETHKSPPAHLMATSTPAKTASKDHQKSQWEQSQTTKEQKTSKKIDFFLTVSSCGALKKQLQRDSRL